MKAVQILILIAVVAHLGVSIYDISQRSRLEKFIDSRRRVIKAGDEGRRHASSIINRGESAPIEELKVEVQSLSDRMELLLDLQGIPTE